MNDTGGKLGAFLLWAFALLFIWLFLGPLTREVVVNALKRINFRKAADYVNSA